MTPEQMAEMEKRMTDFRNEQEKKVMEILDPDQAEQMLGILIKAEESRALSSPTLQETLGFTPEQVAKLGAVGADLSKERQAMFSSMMERRGGDNAGGGFEEMREKMESLRKKSDEQMMAVLTPDQKATLESLKAKAGNFSLPERRFGPPGGPGGPEGPGGPGGPGRGPGGRPGRPAAGSGN
jgi:Spy/CpxP family protein refolding chaperone